MIANFSWKPVYLTKGQTVDIADEHPVALMESNITHGEMFGVMETKNVYHKRNLSTRDIDVIHKHIAEAREASAYEADETINAVNVKLGVDEKYHQEIRKIIRKQNELWFGRLGNFNIT